MNIANPFYKKKRRIAIIFNDDSTAAVKKKVATNQITKFTKNIPFRGEVNWAIIFIRR